MQTEEATAYFYSPIKDFTIGILFENVQDDSFVVLDQKDTLQAKGGINLFPIKSIHPNKKISSVLIKTNSKFSPDFFFVSDLMIDAK